MISKRFQSHRDHLSSRASPSKQLRIVWPVGYWYPWASLAPPIRRGKVDSRGNYSMVSGIAIVLVPSKYGLSS